MRDFALAVGRLDPRWLLLGFLALIDIWSIGLVVASHASLRDKWAWSAVILFCPIVGCLFWYVLGPKPDLVGSSRETKDR